MQRIKGNGPQFFRRIIFDVEDWLGQAKLPTIKITLRHVSASVTPLCPGT